MKPAHVVLIVLLSVITTFVTSKFLMPALQPINIVEPKKESAFEHVKRMSVLRCGYGVWAPSITKDTNTGKLGGIFYDYLEAVGRVSGIKIEWTQEIGWGDFPAALAAGKIDAMCAGMWPKAIQSKDIIFTEPTYYLPVYAYVRHDNHRFDNALDKINTADVKIVTMDSELSSEIAKLEYPQAQTLALPQLSDASMLLVNVADNKADVTFTDAWTGAAYMAKNPDKIRVVTSERPLRLFGHTVALAQGEYDLANVINAATEELINSGAFDTIMHKYATIPGVLLMQKKEYR